MNTPLVLFERYLPMELIFMIQRYLRNDIAHNAVSEYISYLEYTQDMYENFVFTTYIQPNCYCDRLSENYLIKYDGCEQCRVFDNTEYYKISQYLVCVRDNEELWKLHRNRYIIQ